MCVLVLHSVQTTASGSQSVLCAQGQQCAGISLCSNHSIRVTVSWGWGFFNVCQKLQFQSVDTEVKTTYQHGQPSNTPIIMTTPPLLPRKHISMINQQTHRTAPQQLRNASLKTLSQNSCNGLVTGSPDTQTALHQNTTYPTPPYIPRPFAFLFHTFSGTQERCGKNAAQTI